MPWFKCFIEGENFPGALLDSDTPVGFYTTRWVEASSPDEAELIALNELRHEEVFQVAADQRSKDAKVHFTEIVEVSAREGPNTGAAWYVMGT
jgi:hypothetical protein